MAQMIGRVVQQHGNRAKVQAHRVDVLREKQLLLLLSAASSKTATCCWWASAPNATAMWQG
jgi:hypothetical protein